LDFATSIKREKDRREKKKKKEKKIFALVSWEEAALVELRHFRCFNAFRARGRWQK